MKRIWTTAIAVMALCVVVGAESVREMNMMYTGCVEAVNHGGSFLLTHVADDHQAMMPHDGMMKSESGVAKKDEPRASNEMHDDHMMSSAVVLTGRSDLKKHVGQRVTVTGSLSRGMSETMPNGRDTLAVASLKILAKSCS